MFSVGDGENICSNSPLPLLLETSEQSISECIHKGYEEAMRVKRYVYTLCVSHAFLIGGLLLSTVSISVKSKALGGFTVHFMGLGRSSHCVEKFSRHRLFLERTLQR